MTASALVATAGMLAVIGVVANSPGGQISDQDLVAKLQADKVKGWGTARKGAVNHGFIAQDGSTWSVTDAGREQLAQASAAVEVVKTVSGGDSLPGTALDPSSTASPDAPPPEAPATTSPDPASPSSAVEASDATGQSTGPIAGGNGVQIGVGTYPAGAVPLEQVAPIPTTLPMGSVPAVSHPANETHQDPRVGHPDALSPCCKKPSGQVDSKHRQCPCGNTFAAA